VLGNSIIIRNARSIVKTRAVDQSGCGLGEQAGTGLDSTGNHVKVAASRYGSSAGASRFLGVGHSGAPLAWSHGTERSTCE